MQADGAWRAATPVFAPSFWRGFLGLGAGLAAQLGCFYFWRFGLSGFFGPGLLPLGRSPGELVSLLLPLVGSFVAASYSPRSWWWLAWAVACPSIWSLHLLFSTGIEATFHRLPTPSEEWRFLMREGPRFVSGFIGSYFGALLQKPAEPPPAAWSRSAQG
jgi:hypothetical protein